MRMRTGMKPLLRPKPKIKKPAPMKKQTKPKSKKGNTLKLMGKVTHRINGKVVKVDKNAIHADLFTYLQNSMDTSVDNAINNLFETGQIAPGGAQDGRDGIAFYDATGGVESWFSFVTTSIAATETYGKRWKGEVTVSQAREVSDLAIGFDYQAGTPPFGTTYATQAFAGLALQSGATYEVEWEIYLASA